MAFSLTEMTKEDMIDILRGFDSMQADTTARSTWDAFTLGSEDQVGLLETSDDNDIVSWEEFPRKILAKAIREGEIIFRDSIDIQGNEVPDVYDPEIEVEIESEEPEAIDNLEDEELDVDVVIDDLPIDEDDIIKTAEEEVREELAGYDEPHEDLDIPTVEDEYETDALDEIEDEEVR